MDDDKAFRAVVYAIVFTLCFGLGSCCVKDYYSEANLVELVKTGANPIEARCAVYGNERTICGVVAGRKP